MVAPKLYLIFIFVLYSNTIKEIQIYAEVQIYADMKYMARQLPWVAPKFGLIYARPARIGPTTHATI